MKKNPGPLQAALEQGGLESLWRGTCLYVCGSVCVCSGRNIEGKIIVVERDKLEKVNRVNQNRKCVQELKLVKFRSFGQGGSREGCGHVAIGRFLL